MNDFDKTKQELIEELEFLHKRIAEFEKVTIEPKQLGQGFLKTKEFSAAIINSLPGIFYVLDTKGNFLLVNDNFLRVSGYSLEEILNMNALDIFSDADKPRVAERIKETFEKGESSVEADFLTKTGQKTPFYFTGYFVEIEKISLLVGLGIDISKHKEMEKGLYESEQRYRAIIENIGIGIALISPKMEILSLNKQMKQWFPQIDLKYKPICYQAFNNPPRETVCVYCPTVKTLKDGLTHEGTTATPMGDQVVHYRIVSSPIKDETGMVIAAIEMVEDITASNILKQKLKNHVHEMEIVYKANMAKEGHILALEQAVKNLKNELAKRPKA
ncbi:MAG: PAS domain S-box protein [Candidatus Omnitrophota bacterium]